MASVNVVTGEVCHTEIDFALIGPIPIQLQRHYRSGSTNVGAFGRSWEHSLEASLVLSDDSATLFTFPSASIVFQVPRPGSRALHNPDTPHVYSLEMIEGFFVVSLPDGHMMYFDPRVRVERRIPLSSVRHPSGLEVVLTYSRSGVLLGVVDSLKRGLHLHYTDRGLLQRVELTGVLQTSYIALYEYSSAGRLTAATGASGAPSLYTYSRTGLLTEYVDRAGYVRSAIYDDEARCVCLYSSHGGRYRRLRYDTKRKSTVVTDSVGSQTVYRWNDAGVVLESINSDGFSMVTVPDSNGEPAAMLNEMGELNAFSVYDASARCMTVYDSLGVPSELQLDERLRLRALRRAGDYVWKYEWTENGYPLSVSLPTGHSWTFTHHQDRKRIDITDPSGARTYLEWPDPFTFVESDDLGTRSTITFDAFGRLATFIDANGYTTAYTYDRAANIVRILRPDNSMLSARYDGEGNLVEEQDEEGRVTAYQTDSDGNVTTITDPSGRPLHLEYDGESRLIAVVNERGERHTLTRDALGRCVAQTYFDGVHERYSVDPCGRLISFAADDGNKLDIARSGDFVRRTESTDGLVDEFEPGPDGALALFARNGYTVKIKPDALGRPTWTAFDDWSVTNVFDAVGRRTIMRESKGAQWMFEYDPRGRVTGLTDPNGSAHRIEYDAGDRVVQIGIPNGLSHRLGYNSRNQLSWERVEAPGGDVRLERAYSYDASGLRIAMRDLTAGEYRYQYDSRGLLTRVMLNGVVLQEFAYDETRNLLHRGAIYGRGDRLERTAEDSFDYDARGRVESWANYGMGTLRFDYHFDGSLYRVRKESGWEATYQYDPYGRRLKKSLPNETRTFLWDEAVPIVERTERAGSAWSVYYTWFPGTFVPLSVRSPSGVLFLHVDPVGNVDVAWDEQGNEIWSWHRQGWAKSETAEREAARLGIPFRGPGQSYDPETGLYCNGYRYLIPGTGRYLTPDPIRLNGGTNLYACAPDPYNWIDPLGLQITLFAGQANATTFQPHSSMSVAGKTATVYRVDCSTISNLPPTTSCTSPKGPPPLLPAVWTRAGGRPPTGPHNQCVDALSKGAMKNEPGFSLARINQSQLSMIGTALQKVGKVRPDAWGQSGTKSVYGECDHNVSNSVQHGEKLCSNDKNGIVYLAVIP